MPILFRDYETRGTFNLSDVGAWRYATHPETDIWCCAFALDDEPVKLWTPGDPIPPEFIEAAQNSDWVVSAFNDNFERQIEAHIMAPHYGWPTIPIERHRCSQAAALALALPATLEKVALALGLEQQKDRVGHDNMLRMSKPRKPRKDEDLNETYWHDDSERRERLYTYCEQDVETERAIHARIGHLSPDEQTVWILDQTINDRGIHIDRELAEAAIHIADLARKEIDTELQTLTEGAVTSLNQTAKLIAWLNAHGCIIANTQKETLRRALTRRDVPQETRRVMELRLDGAHAAANKFEAMLARLNPDGRLRGAFRYHGASTGRWSSLGVQLQNMKRPIVEDMSAAIAAVKTGDLTHLRNLHDQPMSILGDVARAAICARPGYRLIAADFSGVESRITAWLSGQQSKLAAWAKFDSTGYGVDEPYYIVGQNCGLSHEHARDKGKTADLAFGYGGGEGAFRKLAPDDPSTPEEIKRYQKAWQRAHPATVRFWGNINRAAISAVQNHGKTFKAGERISFRYDADFLCLRLPSGREVAYPFPHVITNDRCDCAVVYKDNQIGKWVDCRQGQGAWHGTWVENAVQAVARDLFAAAMPRLEASGYPIVLHVHDEIVAEVPLGFGSPEEFLQIITALPDWAEGLPVTAKVREGERFCKITKLDHVGEAEDRHDNPAQDGDRDYSNDESNHSNSNACHSDDGDDHYSSGERPWGSRSAEYIYRDEHGEPYLRITRTTAKQFPQYRWENGRWAKGKPAGPKIPYRLPELLAATPEVPVFICEGEKDADNVADLGLIATTNSEGATKGKWTADLNQWFAGKRTVYVLEDNDDDGRRHASEVASALKEVVGEIRIVSFPELPPHGDVSDWLSMGGTMAQLLARAKAGRLPSKGYTLVSADSLVPRATYWAWRGHLARGNLEVMAGLPGNGKSQIQCAMVASFTTGCVWPDGSNGLAPGNVIMLVAEDCLERTLAPRLIAAGANMKRIKILKSIRRDEKDRTFLLAEDMEELERAIHEVGEVIAVTVDPITSYMGSKVDAHKATDVRTQLDPLQNLAERLNICISAVTHPPKNGGQSALNQFIGSQAFIAVPRVGHLCVEEFETDEHGHRKPTGRLLFTNPKNNLVRKQSTIAYHIEDAVGGKDPDTGESIQVSKIVWDGEVAITADEAQAATSPKKDHHTDAATFLMDMLSNGPVPKTLIDKRASVRGFSEDQLKRAKAKMGVIAEKEQKFGGAWFWRLPQDDPEGEARDASKN